MDIDVDSNERCIKHWNDIDARSALSAIQDLVDVLLKWDKSISSNINIDREALQERWSEHREDSHIDMLHLSTYQSAAISHSCIAAFAPFVEGFYTHEFYWQQYLFETKDSYTTPNLLCQRWQICKTFNAYFWNPNKYVDKSLNVYTDIARGIPQLIDALGMKDRMPDNYEEILACLFTYRNKSFHGGYEWTTENRRKFAKFIEEKAIRKTWFSCSTSGGEPQVYYATNEFIQVCLKACEYIVRSFDEMHYKWIQTKQYSRADDLQFEKYMREKINQNNPQPLQEEDI